MTERRIRAEMTERRIRAEMTESRIRISNSNSFNSIMYDTDPRFVQTKLSHVSLDGHITATVLIYIQV